MAAKWAPGGRSRFSRSIKLAVSVVGLLALLFATASLGLSFRFEVPPVEAALMLFRRSALEAVALATTVYDPSPRRRALLGPYAPGDEDELAKYLRLEEAVPSARANNPVVRPSRFEFAYQPYDEPRLHELRERYRLREVAAGAESQFGELVLLRNWCRSRFRRRDYQPKMAHFDALEVLDRDLRNLEDRPRDLEREYDPCEFFPRFYVQVVVSMGHQARLVTISHQGQGFHGVSEVWSNDHGKWVEMDAELNWYYERDGVPLSALEIHEAAVAGRHHGIRIVPGADTSGDPSTTAHLATGTVSVEEMVHYHSYVMFDLRNDWWTHRYFTGHPRRSDRTRVAWRDPRLPLRAILILHPSTRHAEDVYWRLHEVEVLARPAPPQPKELELGFRTLTPNFDHFRIRIDGKHTVTSATAFFTWRLHPGRNELSVQPVNRFGVAGRATRIELYAAGGASRR